MTSEQLPATGFVRLSTIIGNRKGRAGILPIGPTTWWKGVKLGRFPQPVKLSDRVTAWRVEDIRQLIEELGR